MMMIFTNRVIQLSSFVEQLIPLLTRSSLKEGYMEKTGPKVGVSYICMQYAIFFIYIYIYIYIYCIYIFVHVV